MPGLGTAKCLEAAGIAKDEREEEAKRGVRGAISQTALWQDANTSFPHGPPANFPSDSARQLPALSQFGRCHLRLSARAEQRRLRELQRWAQTTTFATTVFRTVYELCFFSSKWSSRTRSLRRQILWLLLRQELRARHQRLDKFPVAIPPCRLPSPVLHVRMLDHVLHGHPLHRGTLNRNDRGALRRSLLRTGLLLEQLLVMLLDEAHGFERQPHCARAVRR